MKPIIYIELLPSFKSARITYENESIFVESRKDYPANVEKAVIKLARKHNLDCYEKKAIR